MIESGGKLAGSAAKMLSFVGPATGHQEQTVEE